MSMPVKIRRALPGAGSTRTTGRPGTRHTCSGRAGSGGGGYRRGGRRSARTSSESTAGVSASSPCPVRLPAAPTVSTSALKVCMPGATPPTKRRGGPSAPSSAPSAVAAGGGGADGGGGGGMRRVSGATCRGLRVEYSLLSRPRPSLSVPSSTPRTARRRARPSGRAAPRAARRACRRTGGRWNGSRRISQYGSGRKLTSTRRNRFTSAASQPRSATHAPSTTRPSFFRRDCAEPRRRGVRRQRRLAADGAADVERGVLALGVGVRRGALDLVLLRRVSGAVDAPVVHGLAVERAAGERLREAEALVDAEPAAAAHHAGGQAERARALAAAHALVGVDEARPRLPRVRPDAAAVEDDVGGQVGLRAGDGLRVVRRRAHADVAPRARTAAPPSPSACAARRREQARGPRVEGGGGAAHALRMRTPFFSSHLRAYRVAPPRPRLASGMSHVSRKPGSSPRPGHRVRAARRQRQPHRQRDLVGPELLGELGRELDAAQAAADDERRAALPISESTCALSRARRATIVGAWRSSVIGASSPPAASTA